MMRSVVRYAGLMAGGAAVVATFAGGVRAQAPAFPDIPANHWAYEAVGDLAAKGLFKGYPTGQFLGNKDLTRYEFALVISRLLRSLPPPPAPVVPPAPVAPPPPGVTQDDLNKVQALVDAFRPELTTLRTDVDAANKQIAALREAVTRAQATGQKALDTANTALDTSYGVGAGRKFVVGGFLQARYEQVDSGSKTLFPLGLGQTNGYNGNYEAGANGTTFKIREARLFFAGQVTPNTRYMVEFGTPGAINTGTTGTAQTYVRRMYGQYTFGDGTPKNVSVTFGQFWLPFGYMINSLRPTWYTPERPLAFNETASGLFANQEFDRGIKVAYGPGKLAGSVAVINGSGAISNDTNRPKDVVARATYAVRPGTLSVGASLYSGKFDTTPSPSSGAKKELYGFDAQLSPAATAKSGVFVQLEYMGGKYEAIPPAALGSGTAVAGGAIPQASAFLPSNKIEGYYAIGGYTFHSNSATPLSLVLSYDEFNRSKNQSTRKDKNFGYGALYNLDKATRFRLFYIKPQSVAHAANVATPPKIGLLTAELQVRF